MSSTSLKPDRGRGKRGASADAVARSHSAASLAALASNPFEARENKRLRVNVLGRRVHGASRNVALARSKAMERRGNTLRKELAAEGRSNTFQDRRFGEYDDTMDAETRMLVRLQRERKRQLSSAGGRKRKFNLEEDAADAPDSLTHFGKSLSEMGAFDDTPEGRAAGDDDADATMDAAVTAAHFGGGASMPDWRGKRPVPAWMSTDAPAAKSYTEIMEEVIAKSKAAKAERAQEKASQDFKLEWLDQRFDTVAKLLHKGEARRAKEDEEAATAASTSAADAFLAAFHAEEAANAVAEGGQKMAPSTATKAFAPVPPSARSTARAAAGDDDFDALLHSLAKQSRAAAAADRTKTADELAAEEHARLTELEALRIARMRGDAAPAAGTSGAARVHEGGDDLGPVIESMLTHRQRKRARAGASILDYSDPASAKGGKAAVALSDDDDEEATQDEEDDEDDDSEDDDDEQEGQDDTDDNDDADEHDSDVMDLEEEGTPSHAQRAHRGGTPASFATTVPAIPATAEEMPFTPTCPRSVEEWHDMLRRHVLPLVRVAPSASGLASASAGKKRSRAAATASAPPGATETVEASGALEELLRRIVACHSIKVKASHRETLAGLYRVLLQDVRSLGDALCAAQCAASVAWRITPLHRTLFNLAQEGPLQTLAAAAWREIVDSIRTRVVAALDDEHRAPRSSDTPSADSAAAPANAAWLTGGELLLVSMARTLFPASDFRHPVLLPLQLLLSQCMTQVPIATETDAACCCVHASVLLDMLAAGRRYAPEAVGSISSCLRTLCATVSVSGALASITLCDADPNWATFAAALTSSGLSSLLSPHASDYMNVPLCVLPAPESVVADATVRLLKPAAAALTRGDVAHALLHSVTALAARVCEYMAPIPATAAPVSNAVADMLAAACAPSGNAARSHAPSTSQTGPPLCLLTHMPQTPFPSAPEVIDDIINPLTILLAQLPEHVHHLRPLRKAMQTCLTHSIARRNGIATARTPMRVFELSGAPRAVRQMAPLVEDINHRKRDIPGSSTRSEESEMAEAARLREELRALNRAKKREMRGAVRELRLDRAYVVSEADKVAAARDVQRTTKFKEVMTSLQVQAADAKLQTRKSAYAGATGTTAAAAPLAGVAKGAAGGAGVAAGDRLRNATRGTKKDRMARKEHSRAVGSGTGGGRAGRRA